MAVFRGAGVAIVTPFTEDNKVNYEELGNMIDYQIQQGTDAIIICGTTGESSTLSHEEHDECIRFAIEKTNKRSSGLIQSFFCYLFALIIRLMFRFNTWKKVNERTMLFESI